MQRLPQGGLKVAVWSWRQSRLPAQMSLPHQAGVGGEKAGRPDPLAGWARRKGRTLRPLPDTFSPGALRKRRVRADRSSAHLRLRGRLSWTPGGRLQAAGRANRAESRKTDYMSLHIRTYREQDRDAVIALWERCALTRPWNDPSADIDLCVRSREATLMVGYREDDLIASVMVGHDGHRGWIYYLAVEPERQGHGHGREMMAEAELWLASRNVGKVQLMVRIGNADAEAFYGALGYEAQDVTVFGKWLNDPNAP